MICPSISDEGIFVASSLIPNAHISEIVLTPALDVEAFSGDPRKELDSHTSMVVIGSIFFVFESNKRNFDIKTFSSELFMAKYFPIFDGALAHDCPFTCKVCVLGIRNALHVTHMDHNLNTPFIMRSSGVIIDDVPNVCYEDPIVDEHSVLFDQRDMRIPLRLNGAFSYFHTIVPTETELYEGEKLFLTPDLSD